MKWGMLNPSVNDLVINGRLEEIVTKPFFRGLLEKKRCVLTFNGYYEWKVNGLTKQPFVFLPAKPKTDTVSSDIQAQRAATQEESKTTTQDVPSL